jgi:hypothetical protein
MPESVSSVLPENELKISSVSASMPGGRPYARQTRIGDVSSPAKASISTSHGSAEPPRPHTTTCENRVWRSAGILSSRAIRMCSGSRAMTVAMLK